jgi:hypothetical protein
MSKRNEFRPPFARETILETRKGVPTNWAGTPDTHHLELPKPVAKPLFARITAKKSGKPRLSDRRRW